MTLADQNFMHDEIKVTLNSRNTSYHWIQNPLSFCLLSENKMIKTCKAIILSVVLCWCNLVRGCGLKVLQNGDEAVWT